MKIFGNWRAEKRAFRAYRQRALTLPPAYAIVLNEIQNYIWSFSLDGSTDLLYDLLTLFEAGAAEGKPVLEITGDNVAGFCDDLLHEWMSRTWPQQQREETNRRIHAQLEALKNAGN